MQAIIVSAALLSLIIWLILLVFWGQFWRADQRLESDLQLEIDGSTYPCVCAVIPARNEADVLPISLRSLLDQDYPGSFTVVLVDDQSSDGTASVAQEIAAQTNQHKLTIIPGKILPPDWTGKLWAMEQGIRHTQLQTSPPDYFLFTDADIAHHQSNLSQLVATAENQQLQLVSLMVMLRCQSFWEKMLIPAFVFFFQKLYPFRWVNNPQRKIAAAAGGCILIRRQALEEIGGIQVLRQALIDDCSLAQAVKQASSSSLAAIWLGLTDTNHSLRAYPSLASIWQMVARTAFTQLNYSPLLLVGTLVGMTLIYLVPPVATVGGLLLGHWYLTIIGLSAWLLMSFAYLPTLKLYRCSPVWALALSGVACLYTLMTLDSALRHWQGRGGAWKGRVYGQ